MNLKDLVKEIFDFSAERDVDLGVSAKMYASEHNIDTKEAEEFIEANYDNLCEAYKSEDESLWDKCFPTENEAE